MKLTRRRGGNIGSSRGPAQASMGGGLTIVQALPSTPQLMVTPYRPQVSAQYWRILFPRCYFIPIVFCRLRVQVFAMQYRVTPEAKPLQKFHGVTVIIVMPFKDALCLAATVAPRRLGRDKTSSNRLSCLVGYRVPFLIRPAVPRFHIPLPAVHPTSFTVGSKQNMTSRDLRAKICRRLTPPRLSRRSSLAWMSY